jgi:uncharacterized protein YndB with AHSA1/START domain
MSLTWSLDFQFTTSIDKVWSALTDSSKFARWFMENNSRLMNIQVKPKSDRKNWRN